MRRMEDVKCIDEAYETHAVTGRWRLVIQIVSGKQIVWGGKTFFPISAVEGCVCMYAGGFEMGVYWGRNTMEWRIKS